MNIYELIEHLCNTYFYDLNRINHYNRQLKLSNDSIEIQTITGKLNKILHQHEIIITCLKMLGFKINNDKILMDNIIIMQEKTFNDLYPTWYQAPGKDYLIFTQDGRYRCIKSFDEAVKKSTFYDLEEALESFNDTSIFD